MAFLLNMDYSEFHYINLGYQLLSNLQIEKNLILKKQDYLLFPRLMKISSNSNLGGCPYMTVTNPIQGCISTTIAIKPLL